ncbi:hypothetical protein [Ideonella sp. B508-1]|uniref:hypothetical protein n=1 Tax=Ideonella sp. B508-1 TaxID=137716 RepID=UPI00034D8343|nr:hypothetical protein [Ideonella sp. B508-1]
MAILAACAAGAALLTLGLQKVSYDDALAARVDLARQGSVQVADSGAQWQSAPGFVPAYYPTDGVWDMLSVAFKH